ncbi:hypothetical protein FRC11_011614 [Ceratobasidium sp. 423]|nr:hypothetical protein FRC11_011614 [Ceratobasidium sp. 423]
MEKKLKTDATLKNNVTVHLNRRVVRVDYRQAAGLIDLHWKASSENGRDGSKDFTQVVLTVSPQVMRLIDLTTCKLDYSQRSAALLLQPGPSIKVGMRFKSNWWKGQDIKGGQSSTDRPVRNVVYPSYGDAQDAVNLGCWMRGTDSFAKAQLRDIILADLAAIHGIELEKIQAEYEEMYAFDWTNNPQTLGAYALFGPGQFGTLLRNLSRPAARGNLHFAGEAISTCHGWVAGSVDSANRAVFQVYITAILRWLGWLRSQKIPRTIPWPKRMPVLLNEPIDLSQESGRDQGEPEGLYTMFTREEAIKQLEISKALQDSEFGVIQTLEVQA